MVDRVGGRSGRVSVDLRAHHRSIVQEGESSRAGLVHALPVRLLAPLSIQAVSVSFVDNIS